ncbi:OmpA family protein [Chondromyces crocatus]|uniref:OmpA family protein n=1 Tax=Chondromyces crocatus TaxID=52 RepID=UPI001FE098B5|nr:OmpA family protein [Chondromyces crocatus]
MTRLSLGAALFFISSTAVAQSAPPAEPAAPPPEAPEPWLPFRGELDLYAAGTIRVGSELGGSLAERGGVQLGFAALIGPQYGKFVGGLGYERSFLHSQRYDEQASGSFSDVTRGLDALWFQGRIYPVEGELGSLFLHLGIGPTWQRLSASTAGVTQGADGLLQPTVSSCSAHGSAGLGLRAGLGGILWAGEHLGFHGMVGIDHQRHQSGVLDGCAPGIGAATFFGARAGITFSEGRRKKEAPPPEPPPAVPDTDGDGILDNVDACPKQPGVPSDIPSKHGCPPPADRDGDQISDDLDACPDVAGVPNQDPRKNGCPPPPDRDGDQISDAEDACPDAPGVATQDPATHGCPPDTDGDGIRDDKDACPQEKGLPNEDPAKHGCPLVQFTEKEIIISQQVQFEVDRALIRSESNGLLDEVANVIKQHPEILKLEVQGHTDNSGQAIRNKLLSQARADAVKKALVQRGVDAKQLIAKGYGDTQPLTDNSTDANKAKNRRVQFTITEKKQP